MAEIGDDIEKAAALLRNGEVVAIPTETVYGLAANALNEDAVRKIFSIKNRPLYNPLIIHVASKQAVKKYTDNIPAIAQQLMDEFWPGPLTLLLQKKAIIPDIVTNKSALVAVRQPKQTLTNALLNALDFPLAAPSANPFGYISPTSAQHVQQQIGKKIAYILDGGKCTDGIESTIIGFDEDKTVLYRYGAIAAETIEKITGPLHFYLHENNLPLAPGMLLKHYSPNTKFILTDKILEIIHQNKGKKIGLLLFDKPIGQPEVLTEIILSTQADLKEAATNLYDALHQLDNANLDIIIAQELPDIGIGKAVNDRLRRAAV